MNQKSAVKKINDRGALLVFPINNKKEPASLWSEFYPRTQMRWEWDEGGDNKVGDLWLLMKKLSDSGQVVYSKWYQGRATFFSRDLFTALLKVTKPDYSGESLSRVARELYDCLSEDSPLSTKQLKAITDLRGKDNERFYNRAMKELFSKFLIVAYGEVDDGAFPSLAVGTTRNLFEDLVLDADKISDEKARETIERFLPQNNLFRKYLEKIKQ